MRDAVLVATVVAFFALAALYVRACDRIVGRDPAEDAPTPAGRREEAPR